MTLFCLTWINYAYYTFINNNHGDDTLRDETESCSWVCKNLFCSPGNSQNESWTEFRGTDTFRSLWSGESLALPRSRSQIHRISHCYHAICFIFLFVVNFYIVHYDSSLKKDFGNLGSALYWWFFSLRHSRWAFFKTPVIPELIHPKSVNHFYNRCLSLAGFPCCSGVVISCGVSATASLSGQLILISHAEETPFSLGESRWGRSWHRWSQFLRQQLFVSVSQKYKNILTEASRGSWTFKVAFCYWSTERETLLTPVAPLGFIFLSLCHRDILETSEQIFTGGTASSEPRTLRSFGSELDLGFLPFDNWKWS